MLIATVGQLATQPGSYVHRTLKGGTDMGGLTVLGPANAMCSGGVCQRFPLSDHYRVPVALRNRIRLAHHQHHAGWRVIRIRRSYDVQVRSFGVIYRRFGAAMWREVTRISSADI